MLYNISFDSTKYKKKCTFLSAVFNVLTISSFILTIFYVHQYLGAKFDAKSNMVFISGGIYLVLASISFYVHEYVVNDADYVDLLPLTKNTLTAKEKKILLSELENKAIFNKISHSFAASAYFQYDNGIQFISFQKIKACIYKSLHNMPITTKFSDIFNFKRAKPSDELKTCIATLADKIKNDVPLTDVDRFEINLLLIKETHLNKMDIDVDVYAIATSVHFNSPDREEQVHYLISSTNRAELNERRTAIYKQYRKDKHKFEA